MSLRLYELNKHLVASFTEAATKRFHGHGENFIFDTLYSADKHLRDSLAKQLMVEALIREYSLPPVPEKSKGQFKAGGQLMEGHGQDEQDRLVRAVFFTLAHPRNKGQAFVSSLVALDNDDYVHPIKAFHLELNGAKPGDSEFYKVLNANYHAEVGGVKTELHSTNIRRVNKPVMPL